MMIVAVPSMGEGGLNDIVSAQFGRCNTFTFVTIDENRVNAVRTVPNLSASALGGAGVQAAQIIRNNGANNLLVGLLGPNAYKALNALNIEIFHIPQQGKTIKECIELYLKGTLKKFSNDNATAHFGMDSGLEERQGRSNQGNRQNKS